MILHVLLPKKGGLFQPFWINAEFAPLLIALSLPNKVRLVQHSQNKYKQTRVKLFIYKGCAYRISEEIHVL